MHIIRMNPLRGGALLVIESKLVFALIDSFFGGPGNSQVKVEGRDFTPIETHMILRVADLIFSDMQKAWEFVEPVTVELERSEVNPQCVGIVPPSAVVVLTPFAVQMDAAHGRLIFCLPYSTLEPIRSKLYAGCQPERLAVDQSWRRRIVHQLENLEVEMSVEFGSAEIHLRSLLGLQVGDIIRLDQDCDQPLVVRVEGVPKFTGLARVVRQKKAVEIVTRLHSQTEEGPNE
jgi:flagellar motor switch protein FliM